MKRIVGISEVVLWADDIGEMVAWYRDFLGLEQLSPPERRSPVFLKAGEGAEGIPQMVVLVQKPDDVLEEPGGYQLHHMAFTLAPDEWDAQHAAFAERDQPPRSGTHPILASRTFYVDDPMGNEVEFICRA